MIKEYTGGADIICKGCDYYKTKDCKKWGYWENCPVKYAEFTFKYGGCVDKKLNEAVYQEYINRLITERLE